MDTFNTNNDNNGWKERIRQTWVELHNKFEQFWGIRKPEAVKEFMRAGASLLEAETSAEAMKSEFLVIFMQQQKALFHKILQQKVDEYNKHKGNDSEGNGPLIPK